MESAKSVAISSGRVERIEGTGEETEDSRTDEAIRIRGA